MLELDLLGKIVNAGTLPTLPTAAVTAIDLYSQPEPPSQEQVVNLFSHDPAMAVQLLKVTNSPMYRFVQRIDNLSQAVGLLGTHAALSLALTFALTETLKDTASVRIDYNHYWKRSLISATAAHVIADLMQIDELEPVLLAGLLQDIGILMLDKAVPDYAELVREAQYHHVSLIDIEKKAYNCDHADVGAWLLEQWNLPQHIVYAVQSSHATLINPGQDQMSTAVALSGWIADSWLADDYYKQTLLLKAVAHRLNKISSISIERALAEVGFKLPEVAMWFNDQELMHLSLPRRAEILEQAKVCQLSSVGVLSQGIPSEVSKVTH